MSSDTKNLKTQDNFQFVIPADLEKSKDGEWKIRGLASTEKQDQQNEVIIQKGIDLTPIDKKKGVINFDHQRGPENTIGLLDGYQRTEKGLFIEGRLFKNHSKAKAVYEIMSSLAEGDRGRVGLSVEGRILERDPANPSIIRKCSINAVAITLNPVNTDTFANLVKSMNGSQEVEFNSEEQLAATNENAEPTFTTSQVMAIVQKALSVGAGAMGAPDAKTGGDALQPSGLESEEDKKKKKKAELEKAGGEGSRGGKVVGHTVAGNPIYQRGHSVRVTAKNHPNHGGRGTVRHHDEKTGKVRVNFGGKNEKEFHVSELAPHSEMKKMSKSLYKSNLVAVLDKLQVLYPDYSRTQIWEAVKDRLETKYDMEKGGPGSGVKGHKTSKMYDRFKWDTKGNHKGTEYVSGKHPDTGKPAIGVWSKEHDDYVLHHDVESHPEIHKAMIRIHNTSGKEREHKLYEDARQREDYERNKDKSRAELNELAEQSGASKHDKEKIRAQADAAIQVGDRDHVRPNVKG